jgi:hypothetical protein
MSLREVAVLGDREVEREWWWLHDNLAWLKVREAQRREPLDAA